MIRLRTLLEDYNEPPEIKKRLGGRYGGEPKKAIVNPGNTEPAMSAKNEAIANAKNDVTPEDSHEIEADLAKQPELDFATHSQKMFEEIDDILGEAGPVGEVQQKLLRKLHGAGRGDHQLSDLARDPEFRRVQFKLIQRAASALNKKKLISYDGISKVSLVEKGMNETTLVTEIDAEITSYKGWPIYALPTYTTPYYYSQQRYVKGKKVGGSAENYPRIKKVEKLIDKWLKQMGLKALNEFQARPSGAKGLGSRASSATASAGNKQINPVPVPEHNNLDEAGPPDMDRPRGDDGYIIRIIQKAGSPEKALRFFDRQSGLGGRKGIIANHAAARMRRYPKDFAKVVRKEEFGDFRGSEVNGAVNDEPLKIKDMVPEKLGEANTFPADLLKVKVSNIKSSVNDMIKHLAKVEKSFNEAGDEIRSIINTEARRDRDLRKGQPSKDGSPSQPSIWSRESEQKTNRVRVAYNALDKALKELQKEVGA